MTLLYQLRKLTFLITLLLAAQITFGQVTPEELKGCYYKRYELRLDTLASTVDINFCINEHADFALAFSIDDKTSHYFGTYQIESDTLIINIDPVFHEFHVGSRTNTRIKKKLTRLTVPSTSDSFYGISFSILTPDSNSTSYFINDLEYNEKDAYYFTELEIPAGAILQLTDIYGTAIIYEYKLPTEANDLYLFVNMENRFTEKLYAIKSDAGLKIAEQKNKLAKADTMRYTPFDANMFNDKYSPQIPKEYAFLRPFNIQYPDPIIEAEADTSAYDYYENDLYTDSYQDTITYTTDYKQAKKLALDSGLYLIMYIEPDSCPACDVFPLTKSVQILNDPYSYHQISTLHAEKSIFYFAPLKDSLRFKQYGITTFPATVVLSNDGKLLYTEQGKDLHFLKTAYNSYGNGDFYAKLDIHKTFTYLPELIKQSDYDSTYILSYLNSLWMSGLYQDGIDDSYAWYEEYNDTNESSAVDYVETTDDIDTSYVDSPLLYEAVEDIRKSSLNLFADTLFTYSLLDTLVTKYDAAILADSMLLTKFIGYFYQLNHEYHPYQLVNNKYTTRKAFQFLLDHYAELKNKSYSVSEYDLVTLYEIITRRINDPIITAVTNNQKTEALGYQLLTIQEIPDLEHFEMPLHINALIFLYDSIHHSTLEEDYVINYLNSIGGKPDQAMAIADSIQQSLVEANTEQTINYDYAYNYYYWFGGNYRYLEDEIPETIYHRLKNGEILNSVAWHYYKFITTPTQLELALLWSKSSLALEPHNPYFLDTYAHLLYKTGKRKEAMKFQKQAIEEMDSKNIRYDIEYTQRTTIKADYFKMKKKTL